MCGHSDADRRLCTWEVEQMSIIINGMEMPKSCYVCPFCDYVSARCDAVKGNPYTPESRYEKRADFCPLVPVPKHGRLIDADALIKGEGRYLISFGKEGIDIAEINRAPTIIPAEEGET